MREHLMAKRMRYLQTVLKGIRAEVSTDELIANPRLLQLIHSLEYQLREMEVAYVGKPPARQAI